MGRSPSEAALATFPSSQAFGAWLARHHKTASELLVRCSKAQAKEKGVTYAEALDEALCFGWIDGVRRSVDAESFSVRFSPRKPKSHWSAVNIRKAAALEAAGRMRPPGAGGVCGAGGAELQAVLVRVEATCARAGVRAEAETPQ